MKEKIIKSNYYNQNKEESQKIILPAPAERIYSFLFFHIITWEKGYKKIFIVLSAIKIKRENDNAYCNYNYSVIFSVSTSDNTFKNMAIKQKRKKGGGKKRIY
jgi:hypothetical protein